MNIAALCLGGTLAACGPPISRPARTTASARLTMLNTLIDFEEPGMLGAFADGAGGGAVDSMMRETG